MQIAFSVNLNQEGYLILNMSLTGVLIKDEALKVSDIITNKERGAFISRI